MQVCAPFVWTADFCPLPHLEAEQVIFMETVYLRGLAVLLGILNPIKTLYLNPHSVSELFGPNPHILTSTEAQSVTVCVCVCVCVPMCVCVCLCVPVFV